MATLMHSGAACALLLAAALWAAGGGADAFHHVTTERCKSNGQVRHYPIDSDADWIWLSNCSLTEINPHDLAGLPNVKIITLYYNSIEKINPATFHNFPELFKLDLNNNKIKHISVEMFAKNKLTQLYLHNNEITSLPPNFVSRLNRAGVPLTYFYFNGNPWRCGCLVELLADLKRAGLSNYKVDPLRFVMHYNGARAECVFSGAEPCRPGHRRRPGMLPPAHAHVVAT